MKLKQLFMIWLMAGLMIVPSGLYLASLAHADGEEEKMQCTDSVNDDEGMDEGDEGGGGDFSFAPPANLPLCSETVAEFNKKCDGCSSKKDKGNITTKKCKHKSGSKPKCSGKNYPTQDGGSLECVEKDGSTRTYICCCKISTEPAPKPKPKPKPNGNAADYSGTGGIK